MLFDPGPKGKPQTNLQKPQAIVRPWGDAYDTLYKKVLFSETNNPPNGLAEPERAIFTTDRPREGIEVFCDNGIGGGFAFNLFLYGRTGTVRTLLDSYLCGGPNTSASGVPVMRSRALAETYEVTLRKCLGTHPDDTNQTFMEISAFAGPAAGHSDVNAASEGQQYVFGGVGTFQFATYQRIFGAFGPVSPPAGFRLLGLDLANTTAEWRWLHIYQDGTLPTTALRLVRSVPIPPNSAVFPRWPTQLSAPPVGGTVHTFGWFPNNAILGASKTPIAFTLCDPDDVWGQIYLR